MMFKVVIATTATSGRTPATARHSASGFEIAGNADEFRPRAHSSLPVWCLHATHFTGSVLEGIVYIRKLNIYGRFAVVLA